MEDNEIVFLLDRLAELGAAKGWHQESMPSLHDESAMVWKDRSNGKFYYAPQGGIVEWTPTHWHDLQPNPALPAPTRPSHGTTCSGA